MERKWISEVDTYRKRRTKQAVKYKNLSDNEIILILLSILAVPSRSNVLKDETLKIIIRSMNTNDSFSRILKHWRHESRKRPKNNEEVWVIDMNTLKNLKRK